MPLSDYFALSSVMLVGGEQGVVTCLGVCNWSQNSRSDRGPFLELIGNFEGNDQHIIFHQSKILMSVTNTSSVTILWGSAVVLNVCHRK